MSLNHQKKKGIARVPRIPNCLAAVVLAYPDRVLNPPSPRPLLQTGRADILIASVARCTLPAFADQSTLPELIPSTEESLFGKVTQETEAPGRVRVPLVPLM